MHSKRITLEENTNIVSKNRKLNLFKREANIVFKKHFVEKSPLIKNSDSGIKIQIIKENIPKNFCNENSKFLSKTNTPYENFENIKVKKSQITPQSPLVNPFMNPKKTSFENADVEFSTKIQGKENHKNENFFKSTMKHSKNQTILNNSFNNFQFDRKFFNNLIYDKNALFKNPLPDFTQLKKVTTVKITDIFSKNNNFKNSDKNCNLDQIHIRKDSILNGQLIDVNEKSPISSITANIGTERNSSYCKNKINILDENNSFNSKILKNDKKFNEFENDEEIEFNTEFLSKVPLNVFKQKLSTIKKTNSVFEPNNTPIELQKENKQIKIFFQNPFDKEIYLNNISEDLVCNIAYKNNKNFTNNSFLEETATSNFQALTSQNKKKNSSNHQIKNNVLDEKNKLVNYVCMTPINNMFPSNNYFESDNKNTNFKNDHYSNFPKKNFYDIGKFNNSDLMIENISIDPLKLPNINNIYSEITMKNSEFQINNHNLEKIQNLNESDKVLNDENKAVIQNLDSNIAKSEIIAKGEKEQIMKNDFKDILSTPGIKFENSTSWSENSLNIQNKNFTKSSVKRQNSSIYLNKKNTHHNNSIEYDFKLNSKYHFSNDKKNIDNDTNNVFNLFSKSISPSSRSNSSEINDNPSEKTLNSESIKMSRCPICRKSIFSGYSLENSDCECTNLSNYNSFRLLSNSSLKLNSINGKPNFNSTKNFLDEKLEAYILKKKNKKEIILINNNENYCRRDNSQFSKAIKNENPSIKYNNTHQVFKEFIKLKDFDRDLNDIEKLGLEKNDFSDYDSDSQITHQLLPNYLRNDELYKQNLINHLRPPNQKKIKTEKIKFCLKRKFSEIAEINFNGNVTRYYEMLGIKIKKCASLKNNFETLYGVEDNKGKFQYFKIYKDSEIGLSKLWQRQLKITEMDDDYMTDNEQLTAAGRHILKELNQGISGFKKDKFNCRNYKFVSNRKKFF